MLKYNKLVLFNEIVISFQMNLELLEDSPMAFLFQLVNSLLILTFSSSLMLHIFWWSLAQPHPTDYNKIKWIL